MHKLSIFFIISFLVSIAGSVSVEAQTNGFTYQGNLNDGATTASGNYDITVEIYDAITSGNLLGTSNLTNVSVVNGVFTVNLNVDPSVFSGAARYLQLKVKRSGTNDFTTLSPRQVVSSSPYSFKSLKTETANNALQLGGVNASQYVQSADSRLTDARDPLPNSPNYIQNTQTTQAASNFNVSGNGTVGGLLSAGEVNSVTEYRLAGTHALSVPGNSLFAGQVGRGGASNVHVGFSAGSNSPTQSVNVAVGYQTGSLTTTGHNNAFLGFQAGRENTSGSNNSMFGYQSGRDGVTGSHNSFFGSDAGRTNVAGSGNTAIGAGANVSTGNLNNATAIGADAVVSQSNSLVLGNSDSDIRVGIGTTAPLRRLEVIDSSNRGLRVQNNTSGGTVASFGGIGEFQVDSPGIPAGRFNIKETGTVILGDCTGCFPDYANDKLIVSGTTRIVGLGTGGSLSLCRNSVNQISSCSSSSRYKSDILPYSSGLRLIDRLQPIAFKWKTDGAMDLGLRAEDVAKVEPLLVTQNDKGEIEGVKYDRVAVVLINAVKEQQAQIGNQQKLIEQQQQQIDRLQAMVRSIKYSGRRRVR